MEVIDFQIQIFFKQKRDTIVKYFAGKPGWCVHFLLFSFSANCNLSHKKVIDGRKKKVWRAKKAKKETFRLFRTSNYRSPGHIPPNPVLGSSNLFLSNDLDPKRPVF